jgi:hypothetical protein
MTSFKTESYEQLNDVKFEGFILHSSQGAATSAEIINNTAIKK